MGKITYIFEEINACNMCGRKTHLNKVLGQRLNKSQGFRPKLESGITTTVIKCKACDLIYSNPLPIPINIQDHYGVPPEDYWQESYFSFEETYFSSQIATAKKLLETENNLKSLDIGAGLGKCMIALEKAGFDSYGIEPSVEFRDKAISKMGINSKKIKLGMLEELDYPPNHFDFITFGAVLEHLYDPSSAIAKVMKWLKSDGILHIEVPSSDYLVPKLINLYYKFIGTNYVNNISPMHVPFHLYEFSYRTFEENAKRNSYKIVFHNYYVCDIYHIPQFLHPLLKSYMKKTNSGMQMEIWLKKQK